MRGTSAGSISTSKSTPHKEITSPKSPPARAINKLSVSKCRIICQRLAPNAARITISFWRTIARANNKLATFAQAINNTAATMPSRSHNSGRVLPTINSRSCETLMFCPALASGYFSRSPCARLFISACACCTVTFGFILASTAA